MLGIALLAFSLFQTPLFIFSTYFGGGQEDVIRDIVSDSQGNIYVAGGSASATFPTTNGAYDRTQNGNMDVVVAKFSPTGQLLWSTFIGGPNYDRAYAIELDPQGDIIVSGRAGRGFPTTAGSFQTTFQGYNTGIQYGEQDAFIAKVSADGSTLLWASYEGPFEMNRDIAVDANGNIYAATSYNPADGGGPINSAWFSNAFQPAPKGSKDGVVLKIRNDGGQVLWATFLGGPGFDSGTPSIRVDQFGDPYVLIYTESSNLPTNTGAFDRSYNGGGDLFLAKLNATGSSMMFGTYLGGASIDFSETHGLAIDSHGVAYVLGTSKSTDFPTTVGAFDTTHNGVSTNGSNGNGSNYEGDLVIAKVSADGGNLLASTFLGGQFGDGGEGIALDGAGNVCVSGATYSTNFPVTDGTFYHGSGDIIATRLSDDLSHLITSSIIGGSGVDYGRTVWAQGGNFYVAGHSSSTAFPLMNAFQNTYLGAVDGVLIAVNAIDVSPFPTPTPTPTPTPAPGPTPPPASMELMLEENGWVANEAAALDSVLFSRDPFPVVNSADLFNLNADRNTRVILFVLNLPATQSASVIVNLVDSNNQSHDVPAEEVRSVPFQAFFQVVFRLPDNLPVGLCQVRVKALGQATNTGVIRIRI